MSGSSQGHDFKESLPYNSEKGCPPGYHKRSEYKAPSGKTVPARCVRSTTTHKESSKEFKEGLSKRMTRRLRMHIPSIRSLSRRNCPPGYIPRKAYVRRYRQTVKARGFTVRKSGGVAYRVFPKAKNMFVASKCIRDLGLPGKGEKSKGIGPLRKGELGKHGYSFKATDAQRHAALKKAAEEYGALGVYRKLDAIAKLTLRTIPNAHKVYMEDRDWVKQNLGPLRAF
jgi:hypothetical protein